MGAARAAARHSATSRVLELAAGRSWTIGAWHGDWTSWNMAWRGDVLQVWDWERFETGVPAGLDLYHFVVNDMVQRKGLDVATIHAALVEVGGRPDDQRARASVLGGVYLLTVAGRYLDAAHGERGDAIRDRASTTLEALIRWLD